MPIQLHACVWQQLCNAIQNILNWASCVMHSAEDQLCNAMHGQGCMREGFRHCLRVNNPLKLISVAFQLVFPIHPLTAVIASFAEDNYGEGLSGCCGRICASRNRCAWVFWSFTGWLAEPCIGYMSASQQRPCKGPLKPMNHSQMLKLPFCLQGWKGTKSELILHIL